MSPKKLQKFAEQTAIKAGSFLVNHQSKNQIVKHKDEVDIATTGDLGSEKIIIQAIKNHFPDHNIFSEEVGFIDNHSQLTWVMDPIDQTKEYSRGLPEFAVLLSCETQQETLAGCFYSPKTNELFSAAKGFGASENGHKISVSSQGKISRCFIGTHIPSPNFPEPEFSLGWATAKKVAQAAYRLRSTSFNARSLCYLAKGALDGYYIFWDYQNNWWDIASSLLIAQEAGAKITNIKGQKLAHRHTKGGLTATNGQIHDQLLKLLS